MSVGPGKYDAVCQAALFETNADATILIVLNGQRGSGFSVTIRRAGEHFIVMSRLPKVLRDVADSIEKDIQQTKNG